MKRWAPRPSRLFPWLVVAQALHRLERFLAGDYVFLPGVVLSEELFPLFAVAWSLWLFALSPSVTHRRPWAVTLGWLVAVVEGVNGGAVLLGLSVRRGYVPGAWSAPLLAALGIGYAIGVLWSAWKGRATRGSARPPQGTHTA